MTRTTQEFGSDHTKSKLDAVQKYLSAFTTALKKQKFTLLYVDACAGSGSSMPKGLRTKIAAYEGQTGLLGQKIVLDADQIVEGSAARALSVSPPFDHYLLNDVKRANIKSLQALVRGEYAHLEDRVTFTQRDANEILLELSQTTNWKQTRAVVFIDPFGLQIKYDTLRALARTEAVDVWYLVPVFAMFRQVRGDGQVIDDGGRSVDDALVTTDWRKAVAVEHRMPGLFEDEVVYSTKAVDVAWFEKVAKERLASAFGGRVLDRALPLGRNGLHEFSLMFASANPSDRAWNLASKLATAVLK